MSGWRRGSWNALAILAFDAMILFVAAILLGYL